MSEVEYNAMKHSLESIVELMRRDWKYFKLGSVDLTPYCFFQDLQIILGVEDTHFEKEEEEEQ